MSKKPSRYRLRNLDLSNVTKSEIQDARTILEYAHTSASAILKAYGLAKDQRGAPRGMTTDEEQDLLRAMLVMAAAGLDGMLKQLIRDSMPTLAALDGDVRTNLQKFITRQIRGEPETPDLTPGAKFLGKILAASSHHVQVIEEWIGYLTAGSLQSPRELFKISEAFSLNPKTIPLNREMLKEIFEIRNNIIHELDIDLSGDRRKRNLRRQTDMIRYANDLFTVGSGFLVQVSSKLSRQE